MKKIPKQEYTTEFKAQAVKQVKMGKSIGLVAKELGLVELTWARSLGDVRRAGVEGTGTYSAGLARLLHE